MLIPGDPNLTVVRHSEEGCMEGRWSVGAYLISHISTVGPQTVLWSYPQFQNARLEQTDSAAGRIPTSVCWSKAWGSLWWERPSGGHWGCPLLGRGHTWRNTASLPGVQRSAPPQGTEDAGLVTPRPPKQMGPGEGHWVITTLTRWWLQMQLPRRAWSPCLRE